MRSGLYDKNNKLIYNWKQLLKQKLITEENNKLVIVNIANKESNLIIPEHITSIGRRCFENSILYSVCLSKNINFIHGTSFDLLNAQEINVDKENEYFNSENGVLFTKNQHTLLRYPQGKQDSEYSVPLKTKKISDSAFYKNKYISKINLNNVEIIEDFAFQRCESLSNINFGNKLKLLGKASISYIPNLKELILPRDIEEIKVNSIVYNENLKCIKYPGNKEELESVIDLNDFEYKTLNAEIIYNYKLSLEELIEQGYNLRDANKILKENNLEKNGDR